ncbi:MAG: acyl-CoA thioesterase [Bacteroidota bacterium]
MARLKIQIPTAIIFETEVTLRITDINYGGHLANDAVLAIVHEARIRFLNSLGFSEKNIEGKGIIMTDAGIIYKSQAYHGDKLKISIAVDEISKLGFDLYYMINNAENGHEIARIKTGITFFDYTTNKIAAMPERFKEKITP